MSQGLLLRGNLDQYMPLPLSYGTKEDFDWDLETVNESLLKRVIFVCSLSDTTKCYHFTLINCLVFSSPSFLYIPAHLCHLSFSNSDWNIYIAYRFTVFTTWTKNMLYLYMLKITWIGHMLASKYVISREIVMLIYSRGPQSLLLWIRVFPDSVNKHTQTHIHTQTSLHMCTCLRYTP